MSDSYRWWRSAAIYQVYPRSFADGNGDGIGDLAGIRARLGYLRDLGVDAIWFSPWYPSPMADAGYDVADYRDIDPAFGTLAEAAALIAEAHALNLRVIVDIVPNHCSHAHPWFREALAAGRFSVDYVDVLAHANGSGRQAIFAEHEAALVEECAKLRYLEAVRVVRYWCQRVDAEGADEQAARDRDSAHIYASRTLDGRVVGAGCRRRHQPQHRAVGHDVAPHRHRQLRTGTVALLVHEHLGHAASPPSCRRVVQRT